MITYISCSKTMVNQLSGQYLPTFTTTPLFETTAREFAMQLCQIPQEELAEALKVSPRLAAEVMLLYRDFCSAEPPALPAIYSYTGVVFKHLNIGDFTPDELEYTQAHLRISSFLYGLLRPLDAIKNYRLEGKVKLPENGNQTMFAYWKTILTDLFIEEIKAAGGVLFYLASNEMKDLFDWKKVEKEVRVITPDFKVMKNGKLASVTIYAKMCRGEMTRFILKNRIESVEALQLFSWEGFRFRPELSNDKKLLFVAD